MRIGVFSVGNERNSKTMMVDSINVISMAQTFGIKKNNKKEKIIKNDCSVNNGNYMNGLNNIGNKENVSNTIRCYTTKYSDMFSRMINKLTPEYNQAKAKADSYEKEHHGKKLAPEADFFKESANILQRVISALKDQQDALNANRTYHLASLN